MRLLGDDPLIFPRQNSGFTRDEQLDWAGWLADDREFAAERKEESNTARRLRQRRARLRLSGLAVRFVRTGSPRGQPFDPAELVRRWLHDD